MKKRLTALRNKIDFRALLWPGALLIALLSVALGLADLVRELEAWLMFPLAIAGMWLGWILARSQLSGWKAAPIGLLVGAGVVLLRVGRLGQATLNLLRAFAALPFELWTWYQSGGAPDAFQFQLALDALGNRTGTLLERLGVWLLGLTVSEAVFDPAATALVWSLAIWLVAFWAGWVLRRYKRPLLGLAPAGLLLAFSLFVVKADISALLWYLGGALMLIAFTRYDAQRRRWRKAGVKVAAGLHGEFVLTAVLLSMTLVAAAALAPAISVQKISNFFQHLAQQRAAQTRFTRSFGLNSPPDPAGPLELVRAPGLPRDQLIGAGPELAEFVVMTVHLSATTTGPILSPTLTLTNTGLLPPRYYWRSLTYDRYTGRGWRVGRTKTLDYQANTWVTDQARPELQLVQQTVQVMDEGDGLIYAAGELLGVDRNYRVAWRTNDEGAPVQDAFGATFKGKTYRAQSQIPLVSRAQLRAAGNAYPAWIKERYLSLPDSVPAEVLGLARDLTATEATPYDRAKAIESYLRTFPYTLDLPAPPRGRDIVDYFLFDLRRGYCDYYASAMAVMARAAGLPARLVVGYASGDYNQTQDRYIVTAANAHSWVEIYFPTYGWVPFEPTAGLPAIERPDEIVSPELPETDTPANRSDKDSLLRLSGVSWPPVAAGALMLVLLGATLWLAGDIWRLRFLSPAAATAIIYRRVYRYANRLGAEVQPGSTPYELAALFSRRLKTLAAEADSVNDDLLTLMSLYVQAHYSPRSLTLAEQRQAIQIWQRLRWRLWRLRVGRKK